MTNLPLFETEPKSINSQFDASADIVLYNGDVNEFLVDIPDQTVKLVVTSPPYNLGKEYEDRVAIEQYLKQQADTIEQLVRVLRPNGSV